MENGRWFKAMLSTRPFPIPHFPFPPLLKDDVLRSVIQHAPSHLCQLLRAFDHGEEVVARELSNLTREHHVAVRKNQLRFTEAAGIPENFTGRWVARVILVADVELELAERDPAAVAAPAAVHELLLVRQQLAERGARLGCEILLKLGDESEVL